MTLRKEERTDLEWKKKSFLISLLPNINKMSSNSHICIKIFHFVIANYE